MALAVGNYIIHSVLGEDIVLLVTGASRAKGAVVTAGAFTETDNRCYWRVLNIKNSTSLRIYNYTSGATNGYISSSKIVNGNKITQNAYKVGTGAWVVEESGNTTMLNGVSVPTYFIKCNADPSLFVTVPDNGGDLYLSTAMINIDNQEFYFERSTYFNRKLATPSKLTTGEENTYVINAGAVDFFPQWSISKTNIVYEIRHRSRCYDLDGNIVDDWTPWNSWTKAIADPQKNKKKKFTGKMRSQTAIKTPDGVDNKTFTKADIQVQARLTSARDSKTYDSNFNTITHGPVVSQIINQWCTPSLEITAALYSPDGLALTYSTDYTVSGSSITINSIVDSSGTILVENYTFTGQDYVGELYLNCDELYSKPKQNDTLTIKATILEENGVVSKSIETSLVCAYDTSYGLDISPVYALTDRLTIVAEIKTYELIQLYLGTKQLNGGIKWIACDVIYRDEERTLFEIVPQYGTPPVLMWVCIDETAKWTSNLVSTGDVYVSSNFYSWYWTDEFGDHHSAILKYQAGEIVKPEDDITLSANKFITTGREYPVFRYTKSVERSLDIEGVILNDESDPYSTREAFESMATANHCIYRQPDGKWYQVAIKSISFERDEQYINVSISQEAETR